MSEKGEFVNCVMHRCRPHQCRPVGRFEVALDVIRDAAYNAAYIAMEVAAILSLPYVWAWYTVEDYL